MSHAQAAHLPIPSRVGNYSLLKTIGKGQFGYVKLAIHDLTRERVAIKVIQKNRLDEKTLKMVSREISIMKLLNHPNVIRLYEVIDSEIFLFLVMEYAAGGEIMDFIVTHGKLKERDARRIFRQVVEAIDYCHEVHVIHRDLKAENLLLDSQLGIKLIDFGLSNRWAPGELLKTFCGSPTYTAPELIKRQQYEGPEVDLWSLGVLLYVLVCGSLPFDGNTFQELFTKIINGQYSVPEHVSPECRDLIGRMLVVNPKQRATLDQVREHPWIRESGKPVPKAHVVKMAVPLSEQDMDYEVLEELMNIGFERDYAIQAVLSNSYDDAAATYYLLVESKKRKTPVSSVAGTPTPQYNNSPSSAVGSGRPPLPLHSPAANTPNMRGAPQHAQPGQQYHMSQQPPHLTISGSPPPGATGPNTGQPITSGTPGGSRAKSTSPATANGHGVNTLNNPLPGPIPGYHSPQTGVPQHGNYHQPQYYQQPAQESGNPAYRGQQGGSRRRERSDGKGHRRHHTVGTPGEFPVDEEDAQSMPPPPSPHHQANPAINYAYASSHASPMHPGSGYHAPTPQTQGLASIQHEVHYTGSGRSGTSTQPTSPTNSRHRSPHKTSREEDDLAMDAEHFSTLTITTATPTSASTMTTSGSSTGSTASTSTTTTTTSTTTKRSKHTRMLSNPPPIEEEEEMFYPPQTGAPYALSSSPSSAVAAHNAGLSNSNSGPNRPARPVGGLQPRSATMRTEKTRHKDHSRPVGTSKKKGHARRPSFDPEEPTESTPLASSKELVRPSEKKLALSSGSNNSSGNAATASVSPRGRKGSKGALGNLALAYSPPLSDEDAHIISLNPSTPPHSPTLRSGLAEPMVDLKGSPFGVNAATGSANGPSASNTPHKPVAVKKESRSIVTRVKGFFSRKSEPEPRQVRFSINENNTTHNPPEVVLARIVEVLRSMNLPNGHFVSPFCLKTETDTGVVLEVEICQLPIIHLIGVRFRRICGDAWKYTRCCKRILDLLDLNNASKGASSSSLSSSTGTGNATSTATHSNGNLMQSSSSSSVPKNGGPLDKSPPGNGSAMGANGVPITGGANGIHIDGATASPSASPSNASILADPFNPISTMMGSSSKESGGKKGKRLSADKASKKSKQHLSPVDDNGFLSSPVSPTKRHTADSDSTFNTSKYKDESPRKHKAPKLPTLHTSQWEDDEDSSSSGALVTQN